MGRGRADDRVWRFLDRIERRDALEKFVGDRRAAAVCDVEEGPAQMRPTEGAHDRPAGRAASARRPRSPSQKSKKTLARRVLIPCYRAARTRTQETEHLASAMGTNRKQHQNSL